jgi:hypothetical protein
MHAHAAPPDPKETPKPAAFDALDAVELDPPYQALLAELSRSATGPAHWRRCKHQQAKQVLALTQVAPRGRLAVMNIQMTDSLDLLLHLNVTVPRMPPGSDELVVEDRAIVAIHYPQEVLTQDLRGTACVRIDQPRHVWLANAHQAAGVLCIGQIIPRNTLVKEIIWLTYTALTMQTVMFDTRDAAGVINPDAARWWAANQDRVPLTRTALLEDQPL